MYIYVDMNTCRYVYIYTHICYQRNITLQGCLFPNSIAFDVNDFIAPAMWIWKWVHTIYVIAKGLGGFSINMKSRQAPVKGWCWYWRDSWFSIVFMTLRILIYVYTYVPNILSYTLSQRHAHSYNIGHYHVVLGETEIQLSLLWSKYSTYCPRMNSQDLVNYINT